MTSCKAQGMADISKLQTRTRMKMNPTNHFRRIMRDSASLYFAPLVGAIRGIRYEWRRIERDARRCRLAEQKGEVNYEQSCLSHQKQVQARD